MNARKPQFALEMDADTKRKLEDLVIVLGKSQAEILRTAIVQMHDSLPATKRVALATLREMREALR